MNLFLILAYITASFLFFVLEYYHIYSKLNIHRSFIAGISITYFFLVVLPEVGENMPELPFHLKNFEYFFILIGFSLHHVVEKILIQNIQKESIESAKDLLGKEQMLEIVERNLQNTLENELLIEHLDILALKEVTDVIKTLKEESERLSREIVRKKEEISRIMSSGLEKLKSGIRIIYHFLIGVLIVGVSDFDIVSGELIVVFGIIMTAFTYKQENKEIDREINIELKFSETKGIKLILSLSTPFGILIGVFLQILDVFPLESVYILFSLIMGSITYSFMRDVIPEKEEGKPYLFLLGIILMSLIVLVFSYIFL